MIKSEIFKNHSAYLLIYERNYIFLREADSNEDKNEDEKRKDDTSEDELWLSTTPNDII